MPFSGIIAASGITYRERYVLFSRLLSRRRQTHVPDLYLLSFTAQAPDESPDFSPDLNQTEPEEEDECAHVWEENKYDLKMHIAAVFIVLATSAFGILSAVFIASNKTLAKRQCVLFIIQIIKFFGIGVIVATAWIHLLTPAFEAFSSDCLLKHGKWGRYGTAYVGLFGMIAAFFVQALEFCILSRSDHLARKKAKAAKQAKALAKTDDESRTYYINTLKVTIKAGNRPVPPIQTRSCFQRPRSRFLLTPRFALLVAEDIPAETALKPDESEECTIPHAHSHEHDDHLDHPAKERTPHKPKKQHALDLHDVTGHSHDVVSGVLDPDSNDADLSTIFLELGMYVTPPQQLVDSPIYDLLLAVHHFFTSTCRSPKAPEESRAGRAERPSFSGLHKRILTYFLSLRSVFHSVIIGLALGVATDEFKSLLIAIVFHQLFEGIALGVRIAEIKRFNSWKKFLAACIYPLTTPVGIAIGIGIRKSFNANGLRALLTQGILDSLSAGILFYNAYVELMAFEMNRNAVFRAHNWLRKAVLFFAVYVGAAIMAVIGLWA